MVTGGYSFRDLIGKRIELLKSNQFGHIVVVTESSYICVKLDNGSTIYIDPIEEKYKIHK
jgi:hypothetical protein